MASNKSPSMMLGIAFQSTRMGYVVSDGKTLLDCGVMDFTLKEADKTIRRFTELAELYQPSMMCVPDLEDEKCRLGKTARCLIERMRSDCQKLNIECNSISKSQIWDSLGMEADTPKYEVATELTKFYREMVILLPAPRKIWDAEPRAMCLFIALAQVHTQTQQSFSD